MLYLSLALPPSLNSPLPPDNFSPELDLDSVRGSAAEVSMSVKKAL